MTIHGTFIRNHDHKKPVKFKQNPKNIHTSPIFQNKTYKPQKSSYPLPPFTKKKTLYPRKKSLLVQKHRAITH